MSRELNTVDDARDILEYFNGFHDGFIKDIKLKSGDRFEQIGTRVTDVSHNMTGYFDAVVEFAHYNYSKGNQPADRLVKGYFKDVKDFYLDLRRMNPAYEWNIQTISIDLIDQSRFNLLVTWSKLQKDQIWNTQEQQIFTFSKATFIEFIS